MEVYSDIEEPKTAGSSSGYRTHPTKVDALAAAALLHDIGKLALGNIGGWAIANLGVKLAAELQPKCAATGEFTHLHALCTAAMFLHPDNRGLFPEWIYYDITSFPAAADRTVFDSAAVDLSSVGREVASDRVSDGTGQSAAGPILETHLSRRWSWGADGEVRSNEGCSSVVDLASRHHQPTSWLEHLLAEANRLSHGFSREEFQRLEDGAAAGEKYDVTRQNCLGHNFLSKVGVESKCSPQSATLNSATSLQQTALYSEFRTRLSSLVPLHPYPGLWVSSLAKIIDDLLKFLPARSERKVGVADQAYLRRISVAECGAREGSSEPVAGDTEPLWEVSLATHVRLVSALATSLFETITASQGETPLSGQQHSASTAGGACRPASTPRDSVVHRNKEADRAQVQLWRREVEEARVLLLSVQLYGVTDFLHEEGEMDVSSSHLIGRARLAEVIFQHTLASLLASVGLPNSNILYATGAAALLILPRVERCLLAIERTRSLIQAWLDDECGGSLRLTMAPLPVAARSLINHQGDEEPAVEMLWRLQDECERREFQPFDLEISGGIISHPTTSQQLTLGQCPFRSSVIPSLVMRFSKSACLDLPKQSRDKSICGTSVLRDCSHDGDSTGQQLCISALTHDELLLAGELGTDFDYHRSSRVVLAPRAGRDDVGEGSGIFGQLVFWDGLSLLVTDKESLTRGPILIGGRASLLEECGTEVLWNDGATSSKRTALAGEEMNSSVPGRELVVNFTYPGKRSFGRFLVSGAKLLLTRKGNQEAQSTEAVGLAAFVQLQRDLQQWRQRALDMAIASSSSENSGHGDSTPAVNFLLSGDFGVILAGSSLIVAKISSRYAEEHFALARFFRERCGVEGKNTRNSGTANFSPLRTRAVLYHRPSNMSIATAWYRSSLISEQSLGTALKAQVVVANPQTNRGLNPISWARLGELINVAGELESWLPRPGFIPKNADSKKPLICSAALRILAQCAEDREAETSGIAGNALDTSARRCGREPFRWRTKIRALVYTEGSDSSSLTVPQMNTLASATKWVENFRGDLRVALSLIE